MLNHMTKETFKKAIDERRFVVKSISATKYEVFMISHDDYSGQFSIPQVIHPNSKDGTFKQTGGGYNKSHACLEDIAHWVDNNAEDMPDFRCLHYLGTKQRWNDI